MQEISTLEGYVLDKTVHKVDFTQKDNITKVYTYTLDATNLMTTIEISKTDIDNVNIENCILELYEVDSKGSLKLIDTWKTSKNNHIIKGLKVNGNYVLKEKSSADNFVLSKDIEFKVKNDTKIQKIKMIDKIVEMSKVDIAGNEVEGATIQVLDKDKNIVDEWISSKKPHKINNLKENETYILHEEISVDGFVKATDIEFTVTEDKQTQHLEMVDKIVEMSKVDISGNEIEGAKIQVLDKDKKIVDEWTSSKEPHKINNLKENEIYILHEEISAEGYVKATDIEFKVTTNKETQKIKMVDKIVEMSKVDISGNEIEGAKIQVLDKDKKIIDEWTSSKEPHKINNLKENETYILHEEISASGYVKATDIEFTVTEDKQTQYLEMVDKIVEMSKKDVSGNELEGAELKVYDKNGKIIDEWTSNKEPHKIKNLVEGETYTLHEEYAPGDFVVATDIEFKVTTDKETQKIEMIDKIVEMSKKDVAGNELEGATIIVTNTRTKNIVDKWVSEKVPHKIQGLIEGQTYIMHEEISVDDYVKATDIEFTVTTDKEIQKIEMIDKIVEVMKTDYTTGKELPGAELTITDEDGNIVDKWVSTEEPHKVKGLEEGKEYTLTEITCPYGYEQAESIKFKVTEEKENQLIEMKDMPILSKIQIIKIDSETKEPIKSKFTFGLYADEKCTELIKEVENDKNESTVLFDNLRYNTYFIKELSAPKRI